VNFVVSGSCINTTAAPMIGLLSSASITFPEILPCWAKPANEIKKKKKNIFLLKVHLMQGVKVPRL
jgi:hypothetical protein